MKDTMKVPRKDQRLGVKTTIEVLIQQFNDHLNLC
jgi:hypothetical protein